MQLRSPCLAAVSEEVGERGQTVERMATHRKGVSQEQVWDSVLLVLSVCLSREEEEAMALLQLLSCRLAGDRRRVLSLSLSLT